MIYISLIRLCNVHTHTPSHYNVNVVVLIMVWILPICADYTAVTRGTTLDPSFLLVANFFLLKPCNLMLGVHLPIFSRQSAITSTAD